MVKPQAVFPCETCGMTGTAPMPRPLPPILRRTPLPPFAGQVLGRILTGVLRRIASRHPGIFTRLGPYQSTRFLIDVTDGPVLLVMEPKARRITAFARHKAAPCHEAAIRGTIAAFLAMLHGREDGDALFFSGALEIAGDTAAVLALRNALDDAELDLTEELVAEVGRAGPLLRGAARTIARQSGLTLTRQESLA